LIEYSYTLDLCNKIPFKSLPEEERKRLWDDGVHFTHIGYDLMGTYVGERLVEIITAQINKLDSGEEEEKVASDKSDL
jgi:hypothetical protein